MLQFLSTFAAPFLPRSGLGQRLCVWHAFSPLLAPTGPNMSISCAPCLSSIHRRHALPFSRESVVHSIMSSWTSCDVSRCSNMLFAWNGEPPSHTNLPRNLAHVLDFFFHYVSIHSVIRAVQNNWPFRRRQYPRPS